MEHSLGWLLRSLGDVDIVEPEKEVAKGEEVVGELTDDSLKNLYYLLRSESARRLEGDILSRVTSGTDPIPPAVFWEAMNRHGFENQRFELLRRLFWLSVRETLDPLVFVRILGKSIDIRKGWKIVTVLSHAEQKRTVPEGAEAFVAQSLAQAEELSKKV